MDEKDRRRLSAFLALLASDQVGERASAAAMVVKLLAKHGKRPEELTLPAPVRLRPDVARAARRTRESDRAAQSYADAMKEMQQAWARAERRRRARAMVGVGGWTNKEAAFLRDMIDVPFTTVKQDAWFEALWAAFLRTTTNRRA